MTLLAIDLFCGLGGWAEGFLSEGWRIIGFDNESKPYPGEFVIQKVVTSAGSERSGGAPHPAHRGERLRSSEMGRAGGVALRQLLPLGGRAGADADSGSEIGEVAA